MAATTDLAGLKIYPYRVLFKVVESDDDPLSSKWACVDLRKGTACDVRDGHLRCLARHKAESHGQANNGSS